MKLEFLSDVFPLGAGEPGSGGSKRIKSPNITQTTTTNIGQDVSQSVNIGLGTRTPFSVAEQIAGTTHFSPAIPKEDALKFSDFGSAFDVVRPGQSAGSVVTNPLIIGAVVLLVLVFALRR